MNSSPILRQYQSLINQRNYAQARYSIARRTGDKGLASMRRGEYLQAQSKLDQMKAQVGIEHLTAAMAH